MPSSPKLNRRWLRYSLRALFVFVTLACVGFGWLGWKLRAAHAERRASMALQEHGAEVTFAPTATFPGLEWLRNLLGDKLIFVHVLGVDLPTHYCTDEALAHCKGFPRLEEIGINGYRKAKS